MKKLYTLLLLLLMTTAASSQTFFYWIGAGADDNWTTSQNWSHSYNGPPITVTTDIPNSPTEIVIFGYDVVNNPSLAHDPCAPGLNKDCLIDGNGVDTTAGRHIGGMLVNDYSGIITQADSLRFVVEETLSGPWSGSLFNKAVFNFGTCGTSTGKFFGSQYSGYNPLNYVLAFYSPLEILSGEFHGTLQPTTVRYDAKIDSGTFFHENGIVWLNCKSSGPTAHSFEFDSTIFHALWIGGSMHCDNDFNNIDFYVDNVFRTLTGNAVKLFNGNIRVRGNVVLDNTFGASITGFSTPWYFGNAIVRMEGTTGPQYMYKPSGNWLLAMLPRIEIDNPSGVFINGPITAYDEIIFTNGVFFPDPLGTGNLLSLQIPTSVTSGVSDASHSEVPFRFRGHFNFEAPVGKGGQARPIIFNFTSNSTYNVYTVEYFNGSAPGIVGAAADASLTNVSTCEYWRVERNMNVNSSATIGVRLQLSYDATSCTFTNPPFVSDCERVVTGWDYTSSEWENYGRQTGPFFASNGDNALKSNLVLNQNEFDPSAPNYGYFTFGIRANPLSVSTSFADVTCNGGNDGSITVTTSGGSAPYQYSIDNCATFQASNVFTGLTAGTYNVCVQDALGCYTSVTTVTISEPSAIVINSAVVNESCEGASDGSIDLSGTSGGTPSYQYSIDNCATLQPSGMFTGLAAGTYTACITDANGCTVSLPVNVAADEPSCCFAAISPLYQHFDTDLNGGSFVVPAGQLIVFPSKVYVASTITVQTGATLDITNSDVVFANGAGIIFQGTATLAAHNSTLRPCITTDTWAGISFTGTSTGVLNENVLISAVTGLLIVSDGQVEVSNNEFQNCKTAVAIAANTSSSMSHSVTGNTVVVNDQNNFAAGTFTGVAVSNITVRGGISQNDFNYSILSTSATGDDFVGINISNGSAIASSNQFNNIRQAYTLTGGTGSNSFEDNTVDYNQSAIALYNPLPLVPITINGTSGVVLIKHNTLRNVRTQNSVIQAAIWVVSSGLVITDNNNISDFSVGIYYRVSGGQISHNNIENSDFSGILADNCSSAFSIRGNTINNSYTDVANFGIAYQVNNGVTLSGVSIENNCVFNTQTAMGIINTSATCLSVPVIRENYLYDYTAFGMSITGFNGTIATGGGRNTFLSNNNAAIDVVRNSTPCPAGPPLFLVGNSTGLSTSGSIVVLPPPAGFVFDEGCNSHLRIDISGDIVVSEFVEANYPLNFVDDHYELREGFTTQVIAANDRFAYASSMLGVLLSNPDATQANQFVNTLASEQVLDATQIQWLMYYIAAYTDDNTTATATVNSITPSANDESELQEIEQINMALRTSGRTLYELTPAETATLTAIDYNRGWYAATARNMLHIANGNAPYIYNDITITLPAMEEDSIPAVNQNQMIVYPNPADDNLSVAFCFDQYSTVTMSITDMQGRVISDVNVPFISGKMDVDVSGLSAGMYMLAVYGDGEQVMSTRFVKNND